MLKDLLGAEFLNLSVLTTILPLLVVVAIVGLLAFRKGERRETRSLFLRALVFLLLLLALADPVKKSSQSSEQLFALVDVSSSVPAEGLRAFAQRLREFLDGQDGLTVSVYPFAKGIQKQPITFESGMSAEELFEELERRAPALDRGDTDIGGALNFASSTASGGAVLLLSDGFENFGNAKEVARTLASAGGRIYPLIPGEEPFRARTVELSMLSAPLTAKAGDLVEVRATARNTTGKDRTGTLEILYDDKPILSQRVSIRGGEERLLSAKTPAIEGGLHRVRAVLKGDDGTSQELHRFVSARNKAKLLLLSGSKEDERVLKQLYAMKGYSVESIVADGQQSFPKDFDETSGIILNNVAENQLPRGYLNQIKSYVSKGGGLLVVGGDRSFGLGNYINTPLEEISPVRFVPPQTAKRRLVKAVALVIDKSRSMAYDGKIEGARDAALLAIRSLKDEDYASVIGFDETAFVVIRMAPVSEMKDQASYRLANLVAMGRTNLLPALIEARRALSKAPADRKHIIVLSDGKVSYAGDEYVQELSRLRQEGITLSAVGLGEDADAPFMQLLAQYGRGAYYQTLSSSKLPEIFIQDIKVATGEKTMREKAEFPIGIGPAGLSSSDIERFPPLRGYVETIPKKGSSIELITKGESQIAPLLASWKYDAGKVIVYTSDANGRWSLPWLNWEGFARFWSQLTEEIEHSPDENTSQVDFDLRTSVNRKSLSFDLAVFDERLKSAAAPRISAEVTLPGGEKRTIAFVPEKKGRFKGVLDNARPGDYRVEILYGKNKLPVIGVSLQGALFGETPGRGINRENLAELASLSGGVINPEPSQVSRATRVVERAEHLFPPLIIGAFILFLLEILYRELGILAFLGRLKRYLPVPKSAKVKGRKWKRA